jgi:hypothetical protein
MVQKPGKQAAWIFMGCILLLSACVRPDNSPSPFSALIGSGSQEQALPEGPVVGPDFIIIPDYELVFSPTTVGFSTVDTISSQGGYLAGYEELIDGERYSGAEIIERVSREYSVHPRLLLALLEMASGWVRRDAGDGLADFPLYRSESTDAVLFVQLSWAADTLNYGYYSRRVGGLPGMLTKDGVEITISQSVNDATAAVQYFLGKLMGYHDWQFAVGPLGLYAQYLALFGDPDGYAVEAMFPTDLAQPKMALPFNEGEGWFFTSGPHSAWGTGAAWAALDFAPDEDGYGCYESVSWVTAAADGVISRVGDGIVVQDLDGDGEEGTGWTILYMHIADDGKVEDGDYLKEGDPIGHPSCAGGPATGTHLHIARRYNGEWIPADQDIPFVLSGWISRGDGLEYDGKMIKEQTEIEASGYPTDEHKIYR